MNKELTPLEALEKIKNRFDNHELYRNTDLQNELNIIETALKDYELLIMTSNIIKNNIKDIPREDITKKLKALEIIKEKQVDVGRFILIINTWFDDDFALHRYNDYLENDLDKWKLTKEEFDLLKEVLE